MANQSELKQLLEKIDDLLEKQQYQDVILLLSNSVLKLYDNTELYLKRAVAYYKREQYDEAIADYKEAIRRQPDYADVYNNRGLCYYRKGEYDKAIADYDKAIRIQPDYALAYHNRGVSYDDKGEHEKAIADYDMAIKFLPEYVDAFTNRAFSYRIKGEYDKAIADYNEVVRLQPKNADAYIDRGICYDQQGKYDKAIADYNKAIEFQPEYAAAYSCRGLTFGNMGKYEKAISDYDEAIRINKEEYDKLFEGSDKAIRIRPDYANAHHNRGVSYQNMGEYEKAISDYNKAIELQPHDALAYMNRSVIHRRNNDYKNALSDSITAAKFNSLLRDGFRTTREQVEEKTIEVPEDRKKRINEAWVKVFSIIEQIVEMLLYKDKDPVVHYTNIKVGDLIVGSKECKLRYSNVAFMNDPEEGNLFVKKCMDEEIINVFENADKRYGNDIYLGSFLPKHRLDDLVMWRTYGKNYLGEDATGCSILIEHTFFDKGDDFIFSTLDIPKTGASDFSVLRHSTLNSSDREGLRNQAPKQPLYKVVYVDENRRFIIDGKGASPEFNNKIRLFKGSLNDLNELRNMGKEYEQIPGLIDTLIYKFLSELRYFFKSSDYQFEQELRVIKYFPINHPSVIVDTGTSDLPRRLYIESSKELQPHLKAITLGPKVVHPERYRYMEALLQQNGCDAEVKYSERKYQ